MKLSNISTKDILYIAEYVSAGGPEMIEDDCYEIIGEDEEGREGTTDISLCELVNELSKHLEYHSEERSCPPLPNNIRISHENVNMKMVASSSDTKRNNGYVCSVTILDDDHGTAQRFSLTDKEAKSLSDWLLVKSSLNTIDYY